MDGFMHDMYDDMFGWYYGSMFTGWIWMGISWILQLVVAYFVYQDAKHRDKNPLLWALLVIIPMLGWLFLVIYIIIRETSRPGFEGERRSARAILDERFAQGEITAEEYRKMKEELDR
jgi:putative membrane protein